MRGHLGRARRSLETSVCGTVQYGLWSGGAVLRLGRSVPAMSRVNDFVFESDPHFLKELHHGNPEDRATCSCIRRDHSNVIVKLPSQP
jgi:hypothetical protein